MLRQQTGFNLLPLEILFEIYSYLSPEQAAVVASVDKASSKIIQGNLFWKKKYKRHFPRFYDVLKSQENINWYAEFRKTYDDEYKDLSIDDRRLFSLVKEGDIESLQAKKIELSSFDKKDKNGQSLLNWAQKVGNQSVLNHFYQIAQTSYVAKNKYAVDVSKADQYGRTILYWAIACYQDYEQIDLLFLQGSKSDEKYFMQYQLIHIAAQEGRLDVVQALIENKPELLEQVDACGQTPLLWAAAKGRTEVVDYLISKGANLNVSSNHPGDKNHGKTPLYWAADRGHSGIVSKLVNAGAAATTALGRMQFQPIHIAAQEGRLDVVQALIENKPELLEQVDARGQTPLLWAAAKGRTEVVDYLISKGANLNVSSNPGDKNHGKTPLYWAADRGHNEVVDTLFKHGMTPSLVKTIDKSKLNKQVKAEVELLEYIPTRSNQSQYKMSFTLFGHKFNFGFSRQEKLDAANALKNVVFNGADKATLDLYKEEELNNGDLGSIYRSLQIR